MSSSLRRNATPASALLLIAVLLAAAVQAAPAPADVAAHRRFQQLNTGMQTSAMARPVAGTFGYCGVGNTTSFNKILAFLVPLPSTHGLLQLTATLDNNIKRGTLAGPNKAMTVLTATPDYVSGMTMSSATVVVAVEPYRVITYTTTSPVTALGPYSLLAGDPASSPAYQEGTGNTAYFRNLRRALYVTPETNVWVTDFDSCMIRQVTTGGVTTALVGVDSTCAWAAGIGTAATLNKPFAIAAATNDTAAMTNIYFSQHGQPLIGRIVRSTRTVSRFACNLVDSGTYTGDSMSVSCPNVTGLGPLTYKNNFVLYFTSASQGVPGVSRIENNYIISMTGNNVAGYYSVGTGGSTISLGAPIDLYVASYQNIYVADKEACAILLLETRRTVTVTLSKDVTPTRTRTKPTKTMTGKSPSNEFTLSRTITFSLSVSASVSKSKSKLSQSFSKNTPTPTLTVSPSRNSYSMTLSEDHSATDTASLSSTFSLSTSTSSSLSQTFSQSQSYTKDRTLSESRTLAFTTSASVTFSDTATYGSPSKSYNTVSLSSSPTIPPTMTPSNEGSATRTFSNEQSQSPSRFSPSISPSVTSSYTATETLSKLSMSNDVSLTRTASATATFTPIVTQSRTAINVTNSPTNEVTATKTYSLTQSASLTKVAPISRTSTISTTTSPTVTETKDQSASRSGTQSLTQRITPSPSNEQTSTKTRSLIVTTTPSVSFPSPTLSVSTSGTMSISQRVTLSGSLTPTVSLTPRITATPTGRITMTSSLSMSTTYTADQSRSKSSSVSVSITLTQSASMSLSTSVSVSKAQRPTRTESVTGSYTKDQSGTRTTSMTLSTSISMSTTMSRISPTRSRSLIMTNTPSVSYTKDLSATKSGASPSQSPTVSITQRETRSMTFSLSPSYTKDQSMTKSGLTMSVSPTKSAAESATQLITPTKGTPTRSINPTRSVSQRESRSSSETMSLSKRLAVTRSTSLSLSTSTSISYSVTLSKDLSASRSAPTPSATFSLTSSLSNDQSKTPSKLSMTVSTTSTYGTASADQPKTKTISLTPPGNTTRSPSPDSTQSKTQTSSISYTSDRTLAKTKSPSLSSSLSSTMAATVTTTFSESFSKNRKRFASQSDTVSMSLSPSASLSTTTTLSFPVGANSSRTASYTMDISASPKSSSLSTSDSKDITMSRTKTFPLSNTVSITPSTSVSRPFPITRTPSVTYSKDLSLSKSATQSKSLLLTPTINGTHTQIATVSPSMTTTPSTSASMTLSTTDSSDISRTKSGLTSTTSFTKFAPPTRTVSVSASFPSPTYSKDQSLTRSTTVSVSTSDSYSESRTKRKRRTASASMTYSATWSRTYNPTRSPTMTKSKMPANTRSSTYTMSGSTAKSQSLSIKNTRSTSWTYSKTFGTVAQSMSDSRSLPYTNTRSIRITGSVSLSVSLSTSLSSEPSLSFKSISTSSTPTLSASLNPTRSTSLTLSITASKMSLSASFTEDQSLSDSMSLTTSMTMRKTKSPTLTPPDTRTQSLTESKDASMSKSFTTSMTQRITQSLTVSMTGNESRTRSNDQTASRTFSISRTSSSSVTGSKDISMTRSVSAETPSLSDSPSNEMSLTRSRRSATPTWSKMSPSVSSSITFGTRSLILTFSPTLSTTMTQSKDISSTISRSDSRSRRTLSISKDITATKTPTVTKPPSRTRRPTPSPTPTLSMDVTPTLSVKRRPTRTMTFTYSNDASMTDSMSTTFTASISRNPPKTRSLSFSMSTSPTVTVSSSLSYTSDASMTVRSSTKSKSSNVTLTGSLTPDVSATHSDTADPSWTDTDSYTRDRTGTPSRPSRSLSASLSPSSSASVSMSPSPSGSTSMTMSSTLHQPKEGESHWFSMPAVSNMTGKPSFTAYRRYHVFFRSLPLTRFGLDKAGIVPITEACGHPTTGVPSPFMTLLVINSLMYQNFTFIPTTSGFFRFCYFSDTTSRWYHVRNPFDPTVAPGTMTGFIAVQARVQFNVVVRVYVRGSNASNDRLILVPFGAPCDSPASEEWTFPWTASDATTTTFAGALTKARDYGLCYVGFPHDRTLAVRLNYVPFRTYATVVSAAWTPVGAPKAGALANMRFTGFGLSVLDSAFLTTGASCDVNLPSPKSWLLNWGRDPATAGLTQLLGVFQPSLPYWNHICFRGNTSKSFEFIGDEFVNPIIADYFFPNGTAWAAGTHMSIRIAGRNVSDADELFLSTMTDCSRRDYSMSLVDPVALRYENTINVTRSYALCYVSTRSLATSLGNVVVVPRYHAPSTIFSTGVDIGDLFNITVATQDLTTASPAALFLVPNGTACSGTIPTDTRVLPVALPTAKIATFKAALSGYWVVCYRTARGSSVSSDVLSVFPQSPTDYSPRIIGQRTATLVTYTGGSDVDFLRTDSIYLCGTLQGAPNPAYSFPGADRRVLAMTVDLLGTYQLCFRSSVASSTRSVGISTLSQSLIVSPVVNRVTTSPAIVPVGTVMTLELSGQSLTSSDVLYLCNASAKTNATSVTSIQNTTDIGYSVVYVNSTYTVWTITSKVAGVFGLCYYYNTKPSFETGPIPGFFARFDPAATGFYPLTIGASSGQILTVIGSEVRQLQRVFVKLNGTDCSDIGSSANTNLVRTNATGSTFVANINRRGKFVVCYVGPSGLGAQVGTDLLTVVPVLSGFTATQRGAKRRAAGNATSPNAGWEFYSNFPISVALTGGGLDYNLDAFFAVLGAVCTASDRTPLTSVDPPIGPAVAMPLEFEAPTAGSFTICYQFLGDDSPTLIPDPLFVINGLEYRNASLVLSGPYVSDASVVAFSVSVTRGSWTLFQTASASSTIPAPYVPAGIITFRAQVLDASGRIQYTVPLRYESTATSSTCVNVPSTVSDTDRIRRFSWSVIIIHNFVAAKCYAAAVDATTALALARSVSAMIKAEQSLVTDPGWVLPLLAAMFSQQRAEVQRYTDVESLLDDTASTLDRPSTSITPDLLDAHVTLCDTAASMLSSLSKSDSRNDVAGQRVVLKIVDRIVLVQRRYCGTSPPADSVYNKTSNVLAVAATRGVVSADKKVSLEGGFGVKNVPAFTAISSSPECVGAAPFTVNPFPQRAVVSGVSDGRRLLQDSTTPSPTTAALVTLPQFNFPIFTYSRPTASGSQPLADTPTVEFHYRVATPARPAGTQLAVDATFYRFVRDSPTSSAGEWVADKDTTARVDSATDTIIVTSNTTQSTSTGVNSQNTATQQTNFLVISGQFLLRPLIPSDAERSVDIALAIYLGLLVVIHIVLCIIGAIADNVRDQRHRPDVQALLQPQDNLTFHRFISVITRKPHHPVFTWARVTTLFSFVFAVSLFSLLIAIAAPYNHPVYLNAPLGLAAATLGTPVAAFVRIGLQLHLHDYASGTAAAAAIVGISIGTPLIGPFMATLIAFGAAVLVFSGTVAYCSSRWSFELQARPGPSPTIFGLGIHVAMEIIAVAYGMYTALVTGTPRAIQVYWDFFQIVAWALALDLIILEPIKNRFMIWLRVYTVARDAKAAAAEIAKPALRRPPTQQVTSPTKQAAGDNDSFVSDSFASTPRSALEEYDIDSTGDVSVAEVNESRPGGAMARTGTQYSAFDELTSNDGDDIGTPTSAGFDTIDVGTPTERRAGELEEVNTEGWASVGTSAAPTPAYAMTGGRNAPYGRASSYAPSNASAVGPSRAAYQNAPLQFDDARSVRSTASRDNPFEEL